MTAKSLEFVQNSYRSTPEDKVQIKLKGKAKKNETDEESKSKDDQSKEQESVKKIPPSIHESEKVIQPKDQQSMSHLLLDISRQRQ